MLHDPTGRNDIAYTGYVAECQHLEDLIDFACENLYFDDDGLTEDEIEYVKAEVDKRLNG